MPCISIQLSLRASENFQEKLYCQVRTTSHFTHFYLTFVFTLTDLDLIQAEKSFFSYSVPFETDRSFFFAWHKRNERFVSVLKFISPATSKIWAHLVMSEEQLDSVINGR